MGGVNFLLGFFALLCSSPCQCAAVLNFPLTLSIFNVYSCIFMTPKNFAKPKYGHKNLLMATAKL